MTSDDTTRSRDPSGPWLVPLSLSSLVEAANSKSYEDVLGLSGVTDGAVVDDCT